MSDDLLTTAQAAERLGIAASSIRFAVRRVRMGGKGLAYARKEGEGNRASYWFDPAEIERYERERRPWKRPDQAETEA